MTINTFIPQVWAGRLLANLNNAHVFAKTANLDYEGEIRGMGSSVRINAMGRITISDYARNTDISGPEQLQLADQSMVIDQGKYFNFAVDDVDARQARASLMDQAMAEASWGLAEAVDDYIAAQLTANVATANVLSAATVGNGSNEKSAYQVLAALDVKLTESNVPRPARWVVVPPWFEGLLRTDQRFVSFGTPQNRQNLRGDPIGEAAGFNVYISNNVPSGTDVLAGYSGAHSYAEQVDKTEAFKPEKRFSDAMKGLLIYGHKVTRPSALAKIVATQGSIVG